MDNAPSTEAAEPEAPQFVFDDPRRVASMLRSYLIDQIYEMQGAILRLERFGAAAVLYPSVQQRLGRSENDLVELHKRHDERVEQVNALNEALDKSSEADIFAFVAEINRRNKAERAAKAGKK